jgi:hypothetical protein
VIRLSVDDEQKAHQLKTLDQDADDDNFEETLNINMAGYFNSTGTKFNMIDSGVFAGRQLKVGHLPQHRQQ